MTSAVTCNAFYRAPASNATPCARLRSPSRSVDKTCRRHLFRSTRARRGALAPSASVDDDLSVASSDDRLIVAITGATGFVGSKLVETLLERGAEVRVLTRDVNRARAKLSPQNLPKGDVAFVSPDKWRRGLLGATHVVNLAGEPISTRWDPKVKGEIMASRVKNHQGGRRTREFDHKRRQET